jgi:O-acetyl-ADP-ribose deacetylase (regulator of RNase III)
MIIYKTGNIFDSKMQIIVNPVNCVGVMGKSLALGFKNRYPKMFKDYFKRCCNKELKIGRPYLFENILNFPTKKHWKDNSKIEDIELGLEYFVNNYSKMNIKSIAFPMLGCGLGGLKWANVKESMEKYLGKLDIEIEIYEN